MKWYASIRRFLRQYRLWRAWMYFCYLVEKHVFWNSAAVAAIVSFYDFLVLDYKNSRITNADRILDDFSSGIVSIVLPFVFIRFFLVMRIRVQRKVMSTKVLCILYYVRFCGDDTLLRSRSEDFVFRKAYVFFVLVLLGFGVSGLFMGFAKSVWGVYFY